MASALVLCFASCCANSLKSQVGRPFLSFALLLSPSLPSLLLSSPTPTRLAAQMPAGSWPHRCSMRCLLTLMYVYVRDDDDDDDGDVDDDDDDD